MKRHTLLTVLVCLTVVLAGCSGWGTDGPTENDTESDDADDLEEASDDANDTESDGNDDAADDTNENGETDGTDDGETDGSDDGDDVPDESENDDEQADESDESENGADDGDDTTDEDDGTTLTVETADVVTGDPVSADVISLEQDGETIDETSGESATFDGLDDGEYELEVYQAQGDWGYSTTLTIDGDTTHVAEIDQDHTYWPRVVATVVDEDGEPIEGATVTFNGNAEETGADGTASHEIEASYTDEREIVVEYDGQSETFSFDWVSWNGDSESITFEAGTDGENQSVALALA